MTGLSYSCAHTRKTIYKAPSRKGPPTKSAAAKAKGTLKANAKSKLNAKAQTQDNGIFHGVVVVSDCLI